VCERERVSVFDCVHINIYICVCEREREFVYADKCVRGYVHMGAYMCAYGSHVKENVCICMRIRVRSRMRT
jgi:hypothetical protein